MKTENSNKFLALILEQRDRFFFFFFFSNVQKNCEPPFYYLQLISLMPKLNSEDEIFILP